jgi:LysM repeat protein
MRISWFKVFLFLLSIGILGATVYGAMWYYKSIFKPEDIARHQDKKPAANLPPPDPGIGIHAEAMTLLEKGEIEAARDRLIELLRHYQDSSKFREAKRVIGEINADDILSDRSLPGKTEYIVQRGDSLAAVSKKNECTLDYILRVNNLFSMTIHPGDRLYVTPLVFEVVVDKSEQSITLLRNGRFFKEYQASELKLPPNTKLPFATTLRSRSAFVDGKPATVMGPGYGSSEKWLSAARAGIIFRSQMKPIEELDTGIFLAPEDMDELYLLLRTDTEIKVVE